MGLARSLALLLLLVGLVPAVRDETGEMELDVDEQAPQAALLELGAKESTAPRRHKHRRHKAHHKEHTHSAGHSRHKHRREHDNDEEDEEALNDEGEPIRERRHGKHHKNHKDSSLEESKHSKSAGHDSEDSEEPEHSTKQSHESEDEESEDEDDSSKSEDEDTEAEQAQTVKKQPEEKKQEEESQPAEKHEQEKSKSAKSEKSAEDVPAQSKEKKVEKSTATNASKSEEPVSAKVETDSSEPRLSTTVTPAPAHHFLGLVIFLAICLLGAVAWLRRRELEARFEAKLEALQAKLANIGMPASVPDAMQKIRRSFASSFAAAMKRAKGEEEAAPSRSEEASPSPDAGSRERQEVTVQ
eukprot:gb/GFBE01073698.1/.p1 GENE.gb/GFBE01073698.1/~~gb/GFBE01073698.1/.p1  ORF type:complete len:357 (+),score=96.13 gb/GFBE01073698.1/:1-1071(+)